MKENANPEDISMFQAARAPLLLVCSAAVHACKCRMGLFEDLEIEEGKGRLCANAGVAHTQLSNTQEECKTITIDTEIWNEATANI